MQNAIRCTFTSADNQCSAHAAPHASEAQRLFETLPWAREVARAADVTGQFPSFTLAYADTSPTHLTISGEEGGTFFLLLEVVLRPGVWGIFGRKAASVDLHGLAPHMVVEHIERFYAMNPGALYAWTQSAPAR